MKGLDDFAKQIFENNVKKGFWDERIDIPEKMIDNGFSDEDVNFVEKAIKAQIVALVHSEASEALEADRKDLMDDKLPQFNGFDVEMVDAFIRILDHFGSPLSNHSLEEVLEAKLAYNKSRPFKHGKQY